MNYSSELQKLFLGKLLLESEISLDPGLLIHPFIKVVKGFENGKCVRCGNEKAYLISDYPCFKCNNRCLYCRNCISMGRVSSCSNLYTWVGPDVEWVSTKCHWGGQLSEQQLMASNKIIESIENNEEMTCWAVAGAGKTEMIFRGIEHVLQRGGRICVACPRTDVILELEPRIKEAFPETSVATLYGDSQEKHMCAQITLSTTHQLYRFKKAFDLIVIDEVDAFPYVADESLQFASREAAKDKSSTVLLTATPTREWQQLFLKGKKVGIHIPARYHRHPNPVPRMQWIGDWRKLLEKGRLPKQLVTWLENQRNPFMVFFPHIESMQAALPLVQEIFPETLSVHSGDPDRKEKVMKLRKGDIPGLLTTTILERGVTIKAVDVAVVGSEDATFTESALVQISGRVGRNREKPDGDIVFFHNGKTKSMNHAIQQIKHNNKTAYERGLLD